MGLASYIINFDELKSIIIDAIANSTISTTVDNVVLDNTSVTIDTSKIEGILNTILTSINNSKDFSNTINNSVKDISDLLISHNNSLNTNFSTLETNLTNILTNASQVYDLLKSIETKITSGGKQRIIGHKLDVAGINTNFIDDFITDKDILLTGISISQSAWNTNDYWDLKIIDYTIFRSIYTKIKGEHKSFGKYYPVPTGKKISLVFNNQSATSKEVWIDYEYIELDETSGD